MEKLTGLSPKEQSRIEALIEKHSDLIDACSRDLAMNFETPTQRIINIRCAQMGINRIDWEKIEAVRSNTEFVAPTAHILRRWEGY